MSDAPSGLPTDWEALIKEAERRGYLEFHNDRVRYKCAQTHDEAWNEPEEYVRAGVYSWLIIEREYPPGAIKVEVLVPRRTPSDYANIVVYTTLTAAPHSWSSKRRSQGSRSRHS